MPYLKKIELPGSTWDTSIKKYFRRNKKKFFRNTWIRFGHFYIKKFFATIKINFPATIKNFFWKLQKMFLAIIKKFSSKL